VSKGGRRLTEDEKQLWRRVASRVKAHRTLPAGDHAPPAPKARPAAPVREAARPPAAPVKRKAPPAPENRGAERRVRRGQLDIDATLDLHGHNQETGRAALGRFLHAAQTRNARVVIVVTGVGRRGEGVLKRMLPEWLAEPELRGVVSGFAQAHRTHGGAGAYYVFLRRASTT
jgi:DNA-nicking Smr family endonuclease